MLAGAASDLLPLLEHWDYGRNHRVMRATLDSVSGLFLYLGWTHDTVSLLL
jgi:hypothetical protein